VPGLLHQAEQATDADGMTAEETVIVDTQDQAPETASAEGVPEEPAQKQVSDGQSGDPAATTSPAEPSEGADGEKEGSTAQNAGEQEPAASGATEAGTDSPSDAGDAGSGDSAA
jgi:hypothetical protein